MLKKIKGIIPQGKPWTRPVKRILQILFTGHSAASCGVFHLSFSALILKRNQHIVPLHSLRLRITSLCLFFAVLSIPVYALQMDKTTILKEISLDNGYVFALTLDSGLLVSYDYGKSWKTLNNGLPVKRVYPFKGDEYRLLTSIYVDPDDYQKIAVTTSSGLYFSSNGGAFWKAIPLGGVVKRTNYITSCTFSSENNSKIIIGTSFNGIFETSDMGKTWKKLYNKDKLLYKGARFYEEVSALALSSDESLLYAACALEGTLFLSMDGGAMTEISVPPLGNELIRSLAWENGSLSLYTGNKKYRFLNEKWKEEPLLFGVKEPVSDVADQARKQAARGRKGLYVNSFHASGTKLDSLIQVVKSNDYNSIVVDMKDDEGIVTYDTALPFPHKIGAVRERFNLSELVEKTRENGIYLIGRIVTFKDPVLYGFDNNRYALRDRAKNNPWGNGREFWVDPFSTDVQIYNISIARELQERGVNEVQFDYIRFPSDGDTNNIRFSFRKDGMSRINALESFVKRGRESISIPISTDIYGFNSWYRMGNWIGQDIEMLSRYVDVISPMFYPSHFPKDFKKDNDYLDWARMIYRVGTSRALTITGGRIVIRPYVQAFLIGRELSMENEEYTRYLKNQLLGVMEGGAEGFTLWNNSNRYYMLKAD